MNIPSLSLLLLLQQTMPVAVTDLPDFEFQGIRAQSKIEMSTDKLPAGKCSKNNSGGMICNDIFPLVSGVRTKKSVLELNNSWLSRLYFSGQQNDFDAINEMITARFGKPCQSREKRYDNKASGKLLTSLDQSWCFRTGKLTLTERAYFSDQFVLEYQDKLIIRPRM